jgi:hypothetical protein
MKKRFDAKKAVFVTARKAHLKKFNDLQDKMVKNVETMVSVVADLVAEVASSVMLGIKLGVNAF